MLIYVQHISPRVKYIVSFLSSFYNIEINYTNEVKDFLNYNGARINYSTQSISKEELWIKPYGLLWENKIGEIDVLCKKHQQGFTVFFKSDDDDTGFDILSAIFFLLTRYEEYLPHKKDMYGRYAHENSIAFKNEFLHLPLINTWLNHFKKLIQIKTGKQIDDSVFNFQPTYDIDIAWSFKNKGIIRNTGGVVKSISNFNFKEVQERIAVLTGKKPDPYDTFDWMEELHQQFKLKPIYFLHVGLEKSIYDKNVSPYNQEMKQLIKSIAVKNKIGLHPSWMSGEKDGALINEKKLLEEITGIEISFSRQHYIRLSFPDTYRKLIAAGIKHDFSMGYGSINGFRASIASSFYWYDLEREEQTNLLIHPFCFMDANSFYEQKQNTEATLTELTNYLSVVKKENGTLTTIWHQNFFGTDAVFAGWKDIYKKFLVKI